MSIPQIEVYKSKDEFSIDGLCENLPKPVFRLLLIGKSGSGKSMIIANMILNKDWYWKNGSPIWDQIYIMSPTISFDPVWKSLTKEPKVLERLSMTDKFDLNTIKGILNSGTRNLKLFILDDFISHVKKQQEMADLFFRSRHINMSVVLVSQSYTSSIPKTIRLNASDYIIFDFGSEKERKIMKEELSTKEVSGEDFVNMMQWATEDKFEFLHKSGNNFYKKFCPIKFIKHDDDD